jgi:hypothetical protein
VGYNPETFSYTRFPSMGRKKSAPSLPRTERKYGQKRSLEQQSRDAARSSRRRESSRCLGLERPLRQISRSAYPSAVRRRRPRCGADLRAAEKGDPKPSPPRRARTKWIFPNAASSRKHFRELTPRRFVPSPLSTRTSFSPRSIASFLVTHARSLIVGCSARVCPPRRVRSRAERRRRPPPGAATA